MRPRTTRSGALARAGRISMTACACVLVMAAARPAIAAVESAPGGVKFSYRAPNAGTVAAAGNFNDWNAGANPMVQDNLGVWSTVIPIGPGEYEYKFVVDGQWVADPENPVTVGEFGNSALSVAADGSLVAMKATSNTELSPKVFLESRYITMMQSRKAEERADREWDFERPDFDVDFDFQIRINQVLSAHVLTNINNTNQNVQLWETNLIFDRGSLRLESEDINMLAFDNDAVGTWDDPLHLVGNIGIYRHPWGFNQQGVMAWRDIGPVSAQLLYSDNFGTGGTQGPSADPLLDSILENGIFSTPGDLGASSYGFSDTDNNKDVLALRLQRKLDNGLSLAASYRADRGANPGAFVGVVEDRSTIHATRQYLVRTYGQTVEDWEAAGADVRYFSDPAGVDLFAEFLVGEASVSAESGELSLVTLANVDTADGTFSESSVFQGQAPSLDARLDTSHRFILGGHYFAFRGWHWRGSVEFEDHDLLSGPGFAGGRYNKAVTYRAGLDFSGEEWKRWPWELGLKLEYYDFSYDAFAGWRDQFWFDDRNFWLEQGEHLITVDRLVMLGGEDVASWRPHARWTFYQPRDATVSYNGILNSTRPGRKPKYWENRIGFHVSLSRRIDLNTDTRIVTYDDPVLRLDETFWSNFVELKYFFTPKIEVALSWGVDPWVIDAPTNEYAPIGRDLFLFDRQADGNTAKTRFLDMSSTIRRAEQALEDEKRVQLEAIIRF